MIDISLLPVDVTEHVIYFRQFFNNSWRDLDFIMNDHDWDNDGNFIDDWLQNCWEFLIERELLGRNNFALTPFSTTHLTLPKRKPTHTIIAIPKLGEKVTDLKTNKLIDSKISFRFFCWKTFRDGCFGLYPPFDLISVIDDDSGQTYTTYFDKMNFILCENTF